MALSLTDFPGPEQLAEAESDDSLRPVEPAYAQVIRIVTGLTALPFLIAAGGAEFALAVKGGFPPGIAIGPVLLLTVLALGPLPKRRWKRWGYSAAHEQLRVARGWMFRTDTIVPFKRIQHIDVAQGPVERLFGLASLTVHTAGTHNSIVTLPGLTRADAEALRDAMRGHIRREDG
jgi:hypothetical protein